MQDTRFTTALQIVASVAVNEGNGVHTTSKLLATGLNANPSFVRKLLGPLSDAGIIAVNTGGRGGITLGRKADQIRIDEIYGAAVPDKKVWEDRADIPTMCVVTRNIHGLSNLIRADVEKCMMESMSSMTLAVALNKLDDLDEAEGDRAANDKSSRPPNQLV